MDIALTLYNPFSFDLDIQSLSIRCVRALLRLSLIVNSRCTCSATGLDFRSPSVTTTVPSESYRVVHISGVASETGTLTIRGVHAQLSGGISTEFLLPIQSADEEAKAERRRSAMNLESGRVKYAGLEARDIVRRQKAAEKRLSGPPAKAKPPTGEPKFLTCKIVEEQPLLRVRKTNLVHGALMLFEGET